MPLHDHFGHDPRPGFIHAVDPVSARWQFRVSLAVAVVLTIAIAGCAFALRPVSGFDLESQRAAITDTAAVAHHPFDARLVDRSSNGG